VVLEGRIPGVATTTSSEIGSGIATTLMASTRTAEAMVRSFMLVRVVVGVN
jgi:hypothetical protein